MKLIRTHGLALLNISLVIGLLALPYVLFQGKYYLSGDDTRFYYLYPYKYFVEYTFTSWHHFSSGRANGPTQFMVPFLLVWSFLELVIPSKIVLGYLGFSLPLLLCFLFSQLYISELISGKSSKVEAFLASIFLVTSPIMYINQYFIFLSTIWLLPLIPLVSYLFLRYQKTKSFKYIAIAIIACFILSIGLFSIPWLLGYILPLIAGVTVVGILAGLKGKIKFIKSSFIFFSCIVGSQLFWLISFAMTYFGKSEINFGSKVFSKEVADTFSPTVLATASGNIIYPLLNLFHRQIAFDSNWQLKHIFLNFFDKIYMFNIFFLVILFAGLLLYKKYLKVKQQRIYLIFLIAFLVSLFFFTVNIGPLKEVFLLMGKIPGFVMFRNFYDKCALAYIFFYSVLIGFSFSMIKAYSIKFFRICVGVFVLLVAVNFTQIGNVVNAPLWLTENTGRNIMIPAEYIDFLEQVGKTVSTSNNIFTIPFGTATYSVIKDTDSDSVYTGTSPVKLFSGVNDISGFLSFYFSEAHSIINQDYKGLQDMLYGYNINYAFVNSNIPIQVLNTWVFDRRMNRALDSRFINNYLEKKPILVSSNGNYQLLQFKKRNTLLKAKNLTYRKVNETKFEIYIENLKGKDSLYYFDSFHPGWKLYMVKHPSLSFCSGESESNGVIECKEAKRLFDGSELRLLFQKPVFEISHTVYSDYFVNKWEVDPAYIRSHFSKDYYKENKDGSIDFELVLYFKPQNYFYLGSIISVVIVLSSIILLSFKRRRKNR